MAKWSEFLSFFKNIVGRYGSKDSKYRRKSKLNDWFKSKDFNNFFRPLLMRALLPLKFLPEHFSFCFQSSNAAKKSLTKWWS